jgi:FtsP/CotA-like multicopper oxidase with cupredoxin domain
MNHKMKTRLPEVIIIGLMALAVIAGPAFGATYNLRAGTTTMLMPDGVTEVTMWGFADVDGDNMVTVPGPRLTVPAGDNVLTVNLTNDLSEPVSIIIPGQIGDPPQVVRNPDGRIRSFTHETSAGGSSSYSWSNIKPGTYLYHSGTHPAVQVQMGLYGAMTNDALDGAYPAIGYDAEALIIYSEIDPALHAAVAGGTYGTPAYPSTIDYQPKYFLVNGVAGDAAGPIATPAPGSNVLIRLLNAGLKDHAPEILGSHLRVIAEDGNLYPYPRVQYSLLLAAGKTLDALLLSPAEGDYPIFDRRLYRTNDGSVQGAMYTKISVQAAP